MRNSARGDDPIVWMLAQIHDRLAEISKALEVCTAKFAHLNAEETREVLKYNAPFLNTTPSGYFMLPDEDHCVGYDKLHGLHDQNNSGGELFPLAWDDERECSIDEENGRFIYNSEKEANNDH